MPNFGKCNWLKKNNMRAAIYNPYLDTLGGGERYSMAFAQTAVKKGYRVDVQWKDSSIKKKLEERFGISLREVNFIKNINRGDNYDVCFWVSDGSIPLLRARNNILHFQIPLQNVKGKSLINRMKLYRINRIVCNSRLTKKHIDKAYGVKSLVIYPPVDVAQIKPKRKEKLIVAIGRFSQLTQSKRQDVLIRAFKKLYDTECDDWKFILAGGTEVGDDKYIDKLKKVSKGYPIDIIESPSFKQIVSLYGKAKVFWSASGYGVDEEKEPMKLEHFGITVVEAMAAGAVPIVYDAGGHKEIIKDGISGYLWKDIRQLIAKSKKVVKDKRLYSRLSSRARGGAKVYSYDKFETEVRKII